MLGAPHAPGQPHQHRYAPSSTDWIAAVAVTFEALIALVIVAGILALLIIL